LLADIDRDGRARVQRWPDGGIPRAVGDPVELAWPLAAEELEDLRWYLEDYLRAPFGVYEDRGPRIAEHLPEWGERIFQGLFGSPAAHSAFVRVLERAAGSPGPRPELLISSASADWLALPWELLSDPTAPSPIVLQDLAVSRTVRTRDGPRASRWRGSGCGC
jgi:hypothetical protein